MENKERKEEKEKTLSFVCPSAIHLVLVVTTSPPPLVMCRVNTNMA
jgi:hypothetical protein